MKSLNGVVAAGHSETAETAIDILKMGGNAFDAAVAAMLTACVAEPVLASLGGGGFLTAQVNGQSPRIYDFFAQTPKQKKPIQELDFYPIEANFGTASQTFHIGMGSIATPGFIRGLFAIYDHHCRLPVADLFQPAIERAKNGVEINQFQHLIASIVGPILRATPGALAVNASPGDGHQLISVGECHKQPALADFLGALQHEGGRLFYEGEAGQRLIKDCSEQGGHLTPQDLVDYQVVIREPLRYVYHEAEIFTNPLPSLGGTLIAFSLGLMANYSMTTKVTSRESTLRLLARTMQLTQQARHENRQSMDRILNPEISETYHKQLRNGGLSTRGTTQISIADRHGNLASMTLSNGEGCGYIIPHTGIMMNNMLGEEDLNPLDFHQWPEDTRLASMMAPTLILTGDGDAIVTGSGGSNRIRSAILQVILNHLDQHMPLAKAVSHPRIHFENNLLSLEPGIDRQLCEELLDEFQHQQHWKQKNLFFGGAHSVMLDCKGNLTGTGDERRGGVSLRG
jgi:gamma-glutamyltranspeptidase/glutathione hydrolase